LIDRCEEVSLPLLDALLHWSVCRSSTASDPLVPGAYVSPHRYAIEILCKLSVQERNVDLLLATPPWDRIEFLLELLSSMLMLGEEIMMREFAVVLVHALCSASAVACVAAALRTKTLQQLVIFLEQADANMHQVVQAHGMQVLRDNPELIGTSVGMLRRAASSLLFMAKLPSTHPKFGRFQQRLLHFTMSHLMDSRVAATVAETLYELQKASEPALATKSISENAVSQPAKLSSTESSDSASDSKMEITANDGNADDHVVKGEIVDGQNEKLEEPTVNANVVNDAVDSTNNSDVVNEPAAVISGDTPMVVKEST